MKLIHCLSLRKVGTGRYQAMILLPGREHPNRVGVLVSESFMGGKVVKTVCLSEGSGFSVLPDARNRIELYKIVESTESGATLAFPRTLSAT